MDGVGFDVPVDEDVQLVLLTFCEDDSPAKVTTPPVGDEIRLTLEKDLYGPKFVVELTTHGEAPVLSILTSRMEAPRVFTDLSDRRVQRAVRAVGRMGEPECHTPDSPLHPWMWTVEYADSAGGAYRVMRSWPLVSRRFRRAAHAVFVIEGEARPMLKEASELHRVLRYWRLPPP